MLADLIQAVRPGEEAHGLTGECQCHAKVASNRTTTEDQKAQIEPLTLTQYLVDQGVELFIGIEADDDAATFGAAA